MLLWVNWFSFVPGAKSAQDGQSPALSWNPPDPNSLPVSLWDFSIHFCYVNAFTLWHLPHVCAVVNNLRIWIMICARLERNGQAHFLCKSTWDSVSLTWNYFRAFICLYILWLCRCLYRFCNFCYLFKTTLTIISVKCFPFQSFMKAYSRKYSLLLQCKIAVSCCSKLK